MGLMFRHIIQLILATAIHEPSRPVDTPRQPETAGGGKVRARKMEVQIYTALFQAFASDLGDHKARKQSVLLYLGICSQRD
jgi:hypothetical protein